MTVTESEAAVGLAHADADEVIQLIPRNCRSRPIQLSLAEATAPAQFGPAFSKIRAAQAQALYVIEDGLFFAHAATLNELALKVRLPAISALRRVVEEGGFMSYGPSYGDLFRRLAGYVDKILKGAKPGDLPVQQPTRFDLAVNLKTAKALGLTIPQSILQRADEVIR